MGSTVEATSSRHSGLGESIKRELESFTNPAADVDRVILRVPDHIKQLNPEAYKPRLVSIGPLHHGKPELQPMEAFKKRCAQNFIKVYSLDIEAFIVVVEKCEEQLRTDYGIDSQKIPSPEFVKIMLIDGAFLLDLFFRPRFLRKLENITSDLLLLENQIPFYYLRHVSAFANDQLELVDLLNNFLRWTTPFYDMPGSSSLSREKKHLLDYFCMSMDCIEVETRELGLLEGLVRTRHVPSCPTVSQLHRAGIKFQSSRTAKITFRNGILELPRFTIDHSTTRHFSNLLALELFQAENRYATEYIAMMDYLIDGPEDVRILVRNGILRNFVEDEETAANLINEIGRKFIYDQPPYMSVAKDLNTFCDKRWVKWKSTHLYEWKGELKRNYFKNPWKALSVIAAVILLGLTVIQTVCSLLQLKN